MRAALTQCEASIYAFKINSFTTSAFKNLWTEVISEDSVYLLDYELKLQFFCWKSCLITKGFSKCSQTCDWLSVFFPRSMLTPVCFRLLVSKVDFHPFKYCVCSFTWNMRSHDWFTCQWWRVGHLPQVANHVRPTLMVFSGLGVCVGSLHIIL